MARCGGTMGCDRHEGGGGPGTRNIAAREESLGAGSCCSYVSPQWVHTLFRLDTDGWSSVSNNSFMVAHRRVARPCLCRACPHWQMPCCFLRLLHTDMPVSQPLHNCR